MVVQYEFAKDEDNNVVNIINAKPHNKYTCANIECNSKMIAVFGLTGRAYHFRHENINKDVIHKGETELHYNTKYCIAQRIRNTPELYYHYISKITGNYVGRINLHSGDGELEVEIEKSISLDYRPDIRVSKNGKLLYIIEIILSHDVEFQYKQYLEKNEILCIKIYTSDSLYRLYNSLNSIDFWSNDSNNEYINFQYHDSRFMAAEEKERIEINKIMHEHEIEYTIKQSILNEIKSRREKTIADHEAKLKTQLNELNNSIHEAENKIKILQKKISIFENTHPEGKWWYDNINKRIVGFENEINTLPIKIIQILNNGLSLYKINENYIEYNPQTNIR